MRTKSTLARETFIIFITLSLFSPTSRAERVEGWYSSAGVGVNTVNTETISKTGTPFGDQPGGNARLRQGYAVVGSAGWGFPHGIRIEAEGGYRRNAFYQATAGALKAADAQGSENKSSLFINALYEYNRPNLGVSPYIGVGAGYDWIKWKNTVIFNSTETVRFNDTQVKLGYQGVIGVSFLNNWLKGVSFTAEYRIRGLDDARTYHGQVLRSRYGAFPTSATVSNSVDQTFLVGVRFQAPNSR